MLSVLFIGHVHTPSVSPHVLVETKESMVVAQQESPHYEDAIPLQPGGVIRVSSGQPMLLPPAPPPPSKDLQECEAGGCVTS